VSEGLGFLAAADPAAWDCGLQADCLRVLAAAESRLTAVRARVLAAFCVPGGGLAGDGHRSARVWLSWQTRATRAAAGAQVAWMRRLAGHPVIAAALAAGTVSVSWARQIADWSGRLPDQHRDDADASLLAAAAAGAELTDLAGLAEELAAAHAVPDADDDDGFADRTVRLDKTFGGAGRLTGDLTAGCAAAVETVLDSLGRSRGPEDDRTAGQRWHDALEEVFRQLIGSGTLPQRAGQPVRLEVGISLAELIAGDRDGNTCDAAIQPVITGYPDLGLLAENSNADGAAGSDGANAARDYGLLARLADPETLEARRLRDAAAAAATGVAAAGLEDVLAAAIRLLSGPGGAAGALRRQAGGLAGSPVSLPLDIATAFDSVPAHLRRAVRRRDRHCRFPGCDMPAAACEVHHIVWRKNGGRHALTNLVLLCRFHHHVAIHRQGWVFALHADGSTTAVSPDGTRTLHSHAPPRQVA